MKRISAAILTLSMAVLVQNGVYAEEVKPVNAPLAGFTFEIPEKYQNLEGYIDFEGGGPVSMDNLGIVSTGIDYTAVTEDEEEEYSKYLEALENTPLEEEKLPEPPNERWGSFYEYGNLFFVYGIDGGRGEKELRAYIKEKKEIDDFSVFEEIGKEGDYTFFLIQFANSDDEEEEHHKAMGDLYDEYCDLRADKETFLSGLTLSEPKPMETAKVGQSVSFSTTDLQGNSLSSADVFAGHKITMVNLWATWCGPCKRELPELARMSKEFEDMGCQLIGICLDASKEGKTEQALSILADAGADYLNLVGTAEIEKLFPSVSIPATYFVDGNGCIVGEPVFGAYIEEYPKHLEEALAAVSK